MWMEAGPGPLPYLNTTTDESFDSSISQVLSWNDVTVSGLLGATSTILLTTLDDCVWLVPFVTLNLQRSRLVAASHATTFMTTFVFLSSTVSILTYLFDKGVARTLGNSDLIFSTIGALICWTVAIFLYWRKWLRLRQRTQNEQPPGEVTTHMQLLRHDYGSVISDVTASERFPDARVDSNRAVNRYLNGGDQQHDFATPTPPPPPEFQLWAVASLTLAGSIDEIAYFPGLITAGIFSASEVIVGAVVAAATMILVVVVWLPRCTPLLEILDNIPLYGVVTVFAVWLTLQVVWDAAHLDSDDS